MILPPNIEQLEFQEVDLDSLDKSKTYTLRSFITMEDILGKRTWGREIWDDIYFFDEITTKAFAQGATLSYIRCVTDLNKEYKLFWSYRPTAVFNAEKICYKPFVKFALVEAELENYILQ